MTVSDAVYVGVQEAKKEEEKEEGEVGEGGGARGWSRVRSGECG